MSSSAASVAGDEFNMGALRWLRKPRIHIMHDRIISNDICRRNHSIDSEYEQFRLMEIFDARCFRNVDV